MATLKRYLILLAAMALTATVTYLFVANHFYRERAATLQSELAQATREKFRLEEELQAAQEQARAARALRLPPATSPAGTNSLRLPSPAPPVPPAAPRDRADVGAVGGVPPASRGTEFAPPAVFFPARPGPGWVRYIASATGSVCTIEGKAAEANGDSRSWSMVGRFIAGYLELDSRVSLHEPASTPADLLRTNVATRADVNIPLRSLKSQATVGASTMERSMLKAMNAQTYPNLHYRLTSLNLEWKPQASGGRWLFDSRGEFGVNGITNIWFWTGIIESVTPDRLRISAMDTFHMAEFNISPPSQTVGGVTLKAEDTVTVHLTWTLEREKPGVASR